MDTIPNPVTFAFTFYLLYLYRVGIPALTLLLSLSIYYTSTELGYQKSVEWSSGILYDDLQYSKKITLDDVNCTSNVWSSCNSSTKHNCDHTEDVLLACETGRFYFLFRFNCYFLFRFNCYFQIILSNMYGPYFVRKSYV